VLHFYNYLKGWNDITVRYVSSISSTKKLNLFLDPRQIVKRNHFRISEHGQYKIEQIVFQVQHVCQHCRFIEWTHLPAPVDSIPLGCIHFASIVKIVFSLRVVLCQRGFSTGNTVFLNAISRHTVQAINIAGEQQLNEPKNETWKVRKPNIPNITCRLNPQFLFSSSKHVWLLRLEYLATGKVFCLLGGNYKYQEGGQTHQGTFKFAQT